MSYNSILQYELCSDRLLIFPPFTVVGTLKGYDQLLNLVLDEAIEYLRGNKILAR